MKTNHNPLERELFEDAVNGTLTEQRYNEILDALFAVLPDLPEATATLKALGRPEWQQRRALHLEAAPAARTFLRV